MDPKTTERREPEKKEETEAGNYFVANYPPFSFWDEASTDDLQAQLEELPGGNDEILLGLYHHIPFCRKRCHFCYFRVYTDKNASEISAYLDASIAELQAYCERPYLRGRSLDFIYFGGGTPSFLSARQLHSLADGLKKIIPWDTAREVTFECEPGTLNARKLKAIKEMGATRLSLGIENFNDRILEINGRAHRSPEVFRAYENARALQFPQINIDLIAGMMGETEENWEDCIEETVSLRPDGTAPGQRTGDKVRNQEKGQLCVLALRPSADNAIREWTSSPTPVRLVSEQGQLTFRTLRARASHGDDEYRDLRFQFSM